MTTPTEYVEHYNTRRPLPVSDETDIAAIYRHLIVGGLINEYHQAA